MFYNLQAPALALREQAQRGFCRHPNIKAQRSVPQWGSCICINPESLCCCCLLGPQNVNSYGGLQQDKRMLQFCALGALVSACGMFVFCCRYPDVFEMYKMAVASFWTIEEVDLSQDLRDWNGLSGAEGATCTCVAVMLKACVLWEAAWLGVLADSL